MRPTEDIKKLIKQMHVSTSSGLDERIDSEISRAMSQAKEKASAQSGLRIRGMIMRNRMIKVAVAAVVIIAVITQLPLFTDRDKSAGVALAGVLERIEQVQGFMYRMKMTMITAMIPGQAVREINTEGTTLISNNYGMKMEMMITTVDANSGPKTVAQQMYVLPEQKLFTMVMPEHKKYMQMEFDDDTLSRMKKQNNDPREMVKQIINCEYTELGRRVIDGVEVEGFQTTDTSFSGGSVEDVNFILWVDVEKWLPVRMEMDIKMGEQMEMSGFIYDYQWDVPVEAGDFEPVIPEDFSALTNEAVKMPSMTEEAAIEGLKFFGEILGQYPKKLNLMNLMQEFTAIRDSENLTEAGLKFREEVKQMRSEKSEIPEEEQTKKMMDMMRPIQSLGMFYMTLVQDKKDPVYYGESVGPEDGDLVLMRWKVSEDQYRVIYGDLTAENVSAERLAQMEAALP